jgi:hypothetical protein
VAATLPETGRHAQVTIHRSAGLAEERLAEWRQRIETGELLSNAPTDEELEPDDTPDLDEFLLPSSAIRSAKTVESTKPDTAVQDPPSAPTEAVDEELRQFFRQLGRRVAHITTPTGTSEEERTED